MKFHANIDRVTLDKSYKSAHPYPPQGFCPFFERQMGNGDTFGLYWPIGHEGEEPIVVEVWHDEWRVVPHYSTLDAFLLATESLGEDDFPEGPQLALDPRSPVACWEAAKQEVQAGRVEAAVDLLETAVAVLPEYTDALTLLGAQYLRLGRHSESFEIALRAIISPPCFGQRPLKLLRWLAAQRAAPLLVAEDPIWRMRGELRLVYGGTKENGDYPLLLNALEQYIAREQTVKALTLMQTYGQLMSSETISFQERYGFESTAFLDREIEISCHLPGGPRQLDFS
jgi:tetratricopeptide (TPR) repeat protein